MSFVTKSKTKINVGPMARPDVVSKRSPVRVSAWMITVNFLRSFKENDPWKIPFCEAAAMMFNDLFNDKEEMQLIINFNARVKNRLVNSSESDVVIEEGPITGNIHAHGVVLIKHQTRLLLAYDKLRLYMLRSIRAICRFAKIPRQHWPTGIYFHGDLLLDLCKAETTKAQVQEYIHKDSWNELTEETPHVTYTGITADLANETQGLDPRGSEEISEPVVTKPVFRNAITSEPVKIPVRASPPKPTPPPAHDEDEDLTDTLPYEETQHVPNSPAMDLGETQPETDFDLEAFQDQLLQSKMDEESAIEEKKKPPRKQKQPSSFQAESVQLVI